MYKVPWYIIFTGTANNICINNIGSRYVSNKQNGGSGYYKVFLTVVKYSFSYSNVLLWLLMYCKNYK